MLDTGDSHQRLEISERLVDIADRAPEIVARHTDLIEAVLHDNDESVCAAGVETVAVMVHQDQHPESTVVSALLDALVTGEDLSVRLSIVWMIVAISVDIDASLGEIDSESARLLRNGGEPIRQQIAADSSLMRTEQPTAFPKLLRGYVDGLTDPSPAVRLAATQTLAVIAHDDADAVQESETVLERIKSIREMEAAEIERAISTVKGAIEGAV